MLRKATLIFLAYNLLSICNTVAQPGGNPGGGGKPGVPISGIEWVIAAGALLGVKKLYNKGKQSSDL